MKNALILHGTGNNSTDNWFQWLRGELEKIDYEVWVPDLPDADRPNQRTYNKFLIDDSDWEYNEDSIIVGHSSGAVAILGLLQALPGDVQIGACYLVGSFKNDLGWESLRELFAEPLDFEAIQQKSKLWYFIHSDDDPYCPLDHAQYLHGQIGGDLIVLPDQKHFSVSTFGTAYEQFPYLLRLIAQDAVDQEFVERFYGDTQQLGIHIWLDGGWAVDALLQKQTRPHADVDIVVQKEDVSALCSYLSDRGFSSIIRDDATAWNFVMGDAHCHMIDVHVVKFDENGNGIYGPEENGDVYSSEALSGVGKIGDIEVQCISPKSLVEYHTGYELRQKDMHDVALLCETFQIPLPKEYAK